MIKKSFVSFLFFLLLFASGNMLKAEPWKEADETQLQHQLHAGFSSAFASPEAFKETNVFKILGYLEPEVSLISSITPRPAQIRVVYEKSDIPGGFKNLQVICSQVGYYNLTIATATFEFPNSRLDLEQLAVNRIMFHETDEVRLKTEVSEADILKTFALFAEARALKDLRIKLSDNRAQVVGWYRQGILVVKFDVRGNVESEGSKVVKFNCEKMRLNGITLPRNAARSLLAKVNPVFDARRTWLNLNVDKVIILEGFVETQARICRRES